MKKLISLLIIGSFLTGCVESSEQSDVLQKALKAIQKDQLNTFTSLLTGKASEKFGSRNGMAEVKRKLGNPNDLSLGKETLKSSWNGDSSTTYSVYNIEILSSKKKILLAEVKCTSVTTSHEWEDCEVEHHEPRDPWPRDDWEPREPREPNPPRYHEPREPNPPRYKEPREPNPPRYKEKGNLIDAMAFVDSYDYSTRVCRTRTSYSTSTNCKISDLQ